MKKGAVRIPKILVLVNQRRRRYRYKGCLPVTSEYRGLGFVNFVQSATFPCADLQSRYLLRVFNGPTPPPPSLLFPPPHS